MTTPDIHCINILLDSPNGNVQLVFNDFIKANAVYERIMKAMTELHEINENVSVRGYPDTIVFQDDYGQKGTIVTPRIVSCLFNDTAASMRGGAEIAILRAVADTQMQTRAAQNPALKAASMMRNFNGAMGNANG